MTQDDAGQEGAPRPRSIKATTSEAMRRLGDGWEIAEIAEA